MILLYCIVESRYLVNEGCFLFLEIVILNDLIIFFKFGEVILGNVYFFFVVMILRKKYIICLDV